MKYQSLLIALCLGILIGITIFTQPVIRTGAATLDCYVDNELCKCDADCICGNKTVPASYCAKNDKMGSN